MRCEIVSSDGMRSSEFTCPHCNDLITVGAAPQYMAGTTFPCTSCFEPLQCLEHTPVYIIVRAPTVTVESSLLRPAPVLDDRVYFEDER